jgi:hypothetical protein
MPIRLGHRTKEHAVGVAGTQSILIARGSVALHGEKPCQCNTLD